MRIWALYAATTALATKLGRNHYDNVCDKIDKYKDKYLVTLWQAHVDHIGVGSTTKKAHMPCVIIKHKKRAGVGIACSFPQEEKQTMKLLITHKKSKVNKKMLLFYDFVKKMSIWLT